MLRDITTTPAYELEFFTYPAGEMDVRDKQGRTIEGITSISATVINDGHILDDVMAIQFLSRMADEVTINLGYIPAGRADRSYDERPAGAAVYASLLDLPNVTYRVADPHSAAGTSMFRSALLREVDVPAKIAELVRSRHLHYTGIIAPDEGAAKRAKVVADALGLPLYQAKKTRDFATGRIMDYDVSGIETTGHQTYLVVDDICDGGGTFAWLASLIEKASDSRTTLDLWVTHPVFSGRAHQLEDHYRTIYTTSDTVMPRTPVSAVTIPLFD